MTEYVALLRGINVGGIRIAMADLRALISELGHTDVSTVLATGNVRFTSDSDDVAALRAQLESALSDRFGYDAFAFVHRADHVAAVTEAYPFEEQDGVHAYVVFVADEAVVDELLGVDIDLDIESVERGDGVVYWSVPQKKTLSSAFGKELGRSRHKATTTNRNLRTLRKILG
ncbi:DUF1697 domain-containing protein [Williamsia deligens]|uniref:DUF1697 domain-containing protein n=1 Tax=Williamsia deligens TaxID=321325 RepID=A0ABW3GEI7_9NOCA|nr:DUF1697 domain-containing protein [Williamsia deligens]MCP2195790.1 Uncharacterized conserved protein, DUF1697 family [Williamsia deligens]